MNVYKYRGGCFDRDVQSLVESFFWAASVETLNDPYEATFENNVKSELEALMPLFGVQSNSDVRNALDDFCEKLESVTSLTSKLGVFSLSKMFDNQLMWSHYADSHRGFCIEYDFDILKQQLNSFGKHLSLNTLYADLPNKIGIKQLLRLSNNDELLSILIGVKPLVWRYEEEVRLIADNFGKHLCDFRAVKSIYFGLRAKEDEKDKAMYLLKGRGINYFEMRKDDYFGLLAFPLADPYKDATPYLYKVSPVQDDAVPRDEMEGKWKNYASYLSKAVEVQRRDPYCFEVCYAAFSVYDSKLDNPIVYVNYKFSENEYMNKSFTISELDKLYASISDLPPII